MNDMVTIEIITNANLAEVDEFVDLIGSETERVYIVAGGMAGHIEIFSARVTDEG